MIDQQKWFLAALTELFRMQKENAPVDDDEIVLALELSELLNKYDSTITKLALKSLNNCSE